MLKRQNRLSEAKAIYKKKYIADANATKGLCDPGRWILLLGCFKMMSLCSRIVSQFPVSVASFQMLEFRFECFFYKK